MRSHACNAEGSGFMDYEEAKSVIPRLTTLNGDLDKLARKDWGHLLRDLRVLQVSPVPHERVVDAWELWCGQGGRACAGSQDGCEERETSRAALQELETRRRQGEQVTHDEWYAASRQYAAGRQPAPQRLQTMPQPAVPSGQGVSTTYHVHVHAAEQRRSMRHDARRAPAATGHLGRHGHARDLCCPAMAGSPIGQSHRVHH